MPNRNCPACSQETIPVSSLLLSRARCPNCGSIVGPHWLFSAISFLIIVTVTIASTLAVLSQLGIYAAILWFSFPIGAIGYLKARFSPLQAKQENSEP